MLDLRVLFIVFIIFSFIGWICEMITEYISHHDIINRGFLIGPYCPVYGVGSVLMMLLISSNNDLISVFLKAVAICSILEYLTSLIMELMFKTRWWDYTEYKFNINGRICLETMVLFGIGGVIVVKYVGPYLLSILNILSIGTLTFISLALAIIFFSDVIVSYNIISSFKNIPKGIRKDSTEEVTKMVRKVLKSKSYLYQRLVNSFPKFKTITKKLDIKKEKKKEKLEKKIKKEKGKLKELKKN